ncbi:calcium/sodium antiporter [Photobacterium angustum]|uniref:Calcium/sodium antiporter n=2 Tax=Photobacterium angustum TaxID=661 RepID=A0A855SA48_PHOAN|nr:calcium/sodium antiporter [Photobacterium angustum]KJF81154.1 calcium/sodium:proton antiporter [Photobacterium damselae subsp. damselae]EAS63681.1 putative Ca2+/Na+ antiporter [Vibrio angustum S14] [Photobacterium angustum S14]KJG29571.1 calcium/sodium:proton antiporter [Photobacterium angustum]KJG39303.1 calcium/sodium:proton antiporter [Photobacterium angustum]KJG44666.1 calcium/sodium:proton antiporter [Photobacterium angustum]
MLEAIVLLCVGLVLLVWSADRLVYGAAALAKNFGVAPLVIGMTILAMGSSAPEMMVSATAALAGKTDTAVGNVLGSNIANIALILGITAMLKPLSIGSTIIRRELPLMLGVTVIAGLLLWDNYLGRMEGAFLAVLFVLFLLAMLKISKSSKNDPLAEEQEAEIPTGVKNSTAIIWVFIGLGLLLYSSDMVVESAVVIAKHYGMSDLVIGLTIIAVGTSLPELAASIASIYKGEDDMAVGNIIGSNVFNILAVMGIPGLLNPSVLSPLAMGRDFYVMLGLSVLLLLMALGKRRRINRVEGGILVLCFIAYQAYLFLNISA